MVGGTDDNSNAHEPVLLFRGSWEELPTVGVAGDTYTGGLKWPTWAAAVMTLPSC